MTKSCLGRHRVQCKAYSRLSTAFCFLVPLHAEIPATTGTASSCTMDGTADSKGYGMPCTGPTVASSSLLQSSTLTVKVPIEAEPSRSNRNASVHLASSSVGKQTAHLSSDDGLLVRAGSVARMSFVAIRTRVMGDDSVGLVGFIALLILASLAGACFCVFYEEGDHVSQIPRATSRSVLIPSSIKRTPATPQSTPQALKQKAQPVIAEPARMNVQPYAAADTARMNLAAPMSVMSLQPSPTSDSRRPSQQYSQRPIESLPLHTLCPEIVVPEGNECILQLPAMNPQASAGKITVNDLDGAAVLSVALTFDGNVRVLQVSSAASGELLANGLAELSTKRVLAVKDRAGQSHGFFEISDAWAGGATYVFVHTNGTKMVFQRDASLGTVNASSVETGKLLAMVEPASPGQPRTVVVGPGGDVGLMVLCLLGIDCHIADHA